jgi:hypothetical protein
MEAGAAAPTSWACSWLERDGDGGALDSADPAPKVGVVPSAAEGFDGSRGDCDTGTGPGAHAAVVHATRTGRAVERRLIVGVSKSCAGGSAGLCRPAAKIASTARPCSGARYSRSRHGRGVGRARPRPGSGGPGYRELVVRLPETPRGRRPRRVHGAEDFESLGGSCSSRAATFR